MVFDTIATFTFKEVSSPSFIGRKSKTNETNVGAIFLTSYLLISEQQNFTNLAMATHDILGIFLKRKIFKDFSISTHSVWKWSKKVSIYYLWILRQKWREKFEFSCKKVFLKIFGGKIQILFLCGNQDIFGNFQPLWIFNLCFSLWKKTKRWVMMFLLPGLSAWIWIVFNKKKKGGQKGWHFV